MQIMETETLNQIKSIKPINHDTVHKICSGQVVLNLATAVKELVENALDAGATVVDVRLKNYGVDLIEVSDNGTGVVELNFAALTQKYCTSKLNDYSDLLGVTSFGFRGEALSSLCALADLTITTRHSSSSYASKVEYDHKGNITKITPCSRQVGTTVTLSNLFSSLPVRQKEFHKNSKREFTKMTQLLYSYCLISVGVKIVCTNTTASNTKSVVVATHGSKSYKDNIASVFGTKQLQTILELEPQYVPNIKENIFKGLSQEIESQDTNVTVDVGDIEIDLSEDSNDTEDIKSTQSPKSQGYKNQICPIEFTGYISSCAHGSGRSSTDRQFYYINSRPCEPTKIIKLINDVYKQYNSNQYPFVFLNVNVRRDTVDVNVTPDKRKVFLTKEKIILNIIKASLVKVFENIPRTLKVEEKIFANNSQEKERQSSQSPSFNSFIQKFSIKPNQIRSEEVIPKFTELKRKSTTMLNFVSTKSIKIGNNSGNDKGNDIIQNGEEAAGLKNGVDESDVTESNLSEYENSITKEETIDEKLVDETDVTERNLSEYENSIIKEVSGETFVDTELGSVSGQEKQFEIKSPKHEDEINTSTEVNQELIRHFPEILQESKKDIIYLESTDNLPQTQIRKLEDVVDEHKIYCKTTTPKQKRPKIKEDKEVNNVVTDKEDLGNNHRKVIKLNTCINHVKALHESYIKQNKKNIPNRIKFRSQISPVFNTKCEEELNKEISKESFKEMAVVGQFNLGFIITRLDEDLFIIDQHATDEIYNFETLQKTTELTSQKLVIPQPLELTGVNEQILLDNLNIFKKNGFTFDINPDAEPTKRVKLLTLPMSKNWIFGKEDIEELLFMLRESPNEYCRPSRVRAMFASRACRKSVMIGTALKKADMKVLVNHMAEIEKPWNCPHGRPTIRHLVNLAMVHIKDEK